MDARRVRHSQCPSHDGAKGVTGSEGRLAEGDAG